MKVIKKILSLFKKRQAKKVLVHGHNGSAIHKVCKGDIIHLPWMSTTCPFHLEPDGTVTLRLIWDEGKARGYGKTWGGITWETINKSGKVMEKTSYYRPKTRGELRDKLQEGIACEVVTDVSEMTEIILRGWLSFNSFTVRSSENVGWSVFEHIKEVK